ncbi:putative transglycosylase [Gloeomargarita lithophora Alchichica-D10]|uniref:peptidoglycan lytic exotransglycosylase n=1 Tax=Gloeomargarita lithophora Alchichica-D10 TaxID=1188229 RepID=A0A1J0AH61_9CYAN|nr:MltA domain-containing protein [Gloeomargarita lithophora]APB35282.1 putative transglycosylase [Gloeomargarita lithophora Alchichica-D10]
MKKIVLGMGLWFMLTTTVGAQGTLVPLTAAQVAQLGWPDDGSSKELEQAIQRSLTYYQQVHPATRFTYGLEQYSPQQMRASLHLFQRVMRLPPDQRRQELVAKFSIFASRNHQGAAFFTGYYQPEIGARDQPQGMWHTPVHGYPGATQASRTEIRNGALAGRAPVLAYVDPIEHFFLQVQGSGMLIFPNGRRQWVGFAGHNNQPYRSIGKLLVNEGVLTPETVSMPAIKTYLRQNPQEIQRVFAHNPRYVFFAPRAQAPGGSLGQPLTAGRSLAMDSDLIPKGGLAFVQTTYPTTPQSWAPLNRFMLVQDTGSAIQGQGRGDIFWGQGATAELRAGLMKQPGQLWLLVAKKSAL